MHRVIESVYAVIHLLPVMLDVLAKLGIEDADGEVM